MSRGESGLRRAASGKAGLTRFARSFPLATRRNLRAAHSLPLAARHLPLAMIEVRR
jgi:hypothetical protein